MKNKNEIREGEHGSIVIPKELVPFVKLTIPEKKQCLECRKEFYPSHGHQKFCGPLPGRKHSSCQNSFNTRIKRKRARAKRLTEKGLSIEEISKKMKIDTAEVQIYLKN